MDISKIKKKIRFLERQRQKKLTYLLNPKDMIAGSIYRKVGGVTKLTFVRRADEDIIEEKAKNYRKYTKAVADLGKLNLKIYDNIKKIKEVKTKNYEPGKV